jgi:hypothetical protein
MRAGFSLTCFPHALLSEFTVREQSSLIAKAFCFGGKALFEGFDFLDVVLHGATLQIRARSDTQLQRERGGVPVQFQTQVRKTSMRTLFVF